MSDPLLSPAELSSLRAAFDAQLLLAVAERSVEGVCPELKPFAAAMRSAFDNKALSGPEREVAVLVLMAQDKAPLAFGLHVYWGLMEGLEVAGLWALIPLLAAYRGTHFATDTGRLLSRALSALSSVARAQERGPLAVVAALQKANG